MNIHIPKVCTNHPPFLCFSKDKDKPQAVRQGNITAARAVSDAIRTSLGPRGMDKMIQTGKGETIITNDGNTMLKDMTVMVSSVDKSSS